MVRHAGLVTNLVLGLIFLALLATETTVTAALHQNWLFVLVTGAIVCILALERNRNEFWTAVAALSGCAVAGGVAGIAHAPAQPGVVATAGLLVLGATCVRVASAGRAIVVAAAGAVVMVLGRIDGQGHYAAAFAVVAVLLWGSALCIGLWLRDLDTRHRTRVDAARRAERMELARELHDEVAHHVASVVIHTQAARVVMSQRPETLDGALAGIESAGAEALSAMRRVLGLLRDTEDGAPRTTGPERLRDMVDRFAGQGPAVALHLSTEDPPTWPAEVTTTVYRVVQEALTNVIRHAPGARWATVTVDSCPSSVTVEITNDAAGRLAFFTHGSGYGLIGMRERVEALGGTLTAGPRQSGGWLVRASVPLLPGRGL